MSEPYQFVIVPKTLDPFYDEVWLGCEARAREYLASHNVAVECHYVGYPEAIPEEQARIIRELVTNPTNHNLTRVPDGISVAALDEEITGAAIDFVYDSGVPIITFDSDAPQSKRQAFVSTDNYAFGLELGKVLDQLNPNGGYFGMITGNGPNLKDRLQGVRDRLLNDPLQPTRWKEVDYSPFNCDNNVTLANELMHEYAKDENIAAIIPVGGWPMFNDELWREFVDQNRDIFTVVADSVAIQIELMGQGYVRGLVGQLPYQMGEFSARELFSIATTIDPTRQPQEVFGTHMLEILRVPLELPPLTVNQNHIGSVAILGYILFPIVALASIVIAFWVYTHKTSHVIRVSQPTFLFMICAGVLILGSALIPLTIDDGSASQHSADIACQSVPWLISVGFTTAFAALFSKTLRIYQLVRGAEKFQRIKVSVGDVMGPYAALMLINIITLICWTAIAPLKYVRTPNLGTDDWNRAISTHGSCQSDGRGMPFFVVLVCVNLFVLIILNIYAYLSRHIHTEYSESRYIGLVNASMLQAAVIGLPVVYLVYDDPLTYYIVITLLISVTCMAILGFIMYPKYVGLKQWREDVKRSMIQTATTKPSRRGSFLQTFDPNPKGMRCAVIDQSAEFKRLQQSFQQEEDSAMSFESGPGSTDIQTAAMTAVEQLSWEEQEKVRKILQMYNVLNRNERQGLMKRLTVSRDSDERGPVSADYDDDDEDDDDDDNEIDDIGNDRALSEVSE